MTTTPLTAAQLAEIRADLAASNTARRAIPASHYARVLLADRDRLAAELGRVRAELTTAQARIDAVLALDFADREQLEQMDPEQYHHADGYGDAIWAVQMILTDPADPAASVPSA